jgi:glycosyltransferase involved in cell wall biosynthesis
MPVKVIELECTEPIKTLWGVEGYDCLQILIRYRRRPIGWVYISHPKHQPAISADCLQREVYKQLGWDLVQTFINQSLSLAPHAGTNKASLKPISVVVCSRDRSNQLAHCLQALLKLDYPNYEIIVVDNAPSNDATAKLVAALPVRYVLENKPGLNWARNRGIAEAQHELVAFTDDDAQVDRFWLRAIAADFIDPSIMAVTGLTCPAELETPSQTLFEWGYGGMGHGFQRRTIRRDEISEKSLLWASGYGVGANMSFRKEVFAQIGLFDVALDVGTPSRGGGDVEMFHRLVAQGYHLVYEPEMLVWHTHRRSFSLLSQQIYNNGRSFGCYLLTCARHRSVKRSLILQFLLLDWLGQWILKRLIRPGNFPRRLVFTELFGMLGSAFAYKAAQLKARQLADSYSEPT